MAITILKSPQLYEPTYNRIEYVCSSTNIAQPGFVFIADIYIAGSGTKEKRLVITPEENTGNQYGITFINEILESFVTFDLGDNTSTDGVTANDNSIVDYIVKFGERYEVAGVTTVFPDLTVDTKKYVWNGAWTYPDHVSIGYATYLLTANTRLFLTKAPSTVKTMSTNSGWLYFFPSGAPATDVIKVETFNSSGASLGTWTIDNPLTFADTGEYMAKVPAHPHTLNLIDNANLSTGVQPIITSATASYTMVALDNTTAEISETRTYEIIDPCKFDRWNVIFLNRNGGFDSFTFSLLSRDVDDIERSFYKKNPVRVTGAGNYLYTLADREKVTFYTKSVKKRTLHSDWITEDESEWLEELVSSPEVYLEDTSNNLIAVTIKNPNWTKRTRVNDKLFNLTLELEMYDNYRQRG